MNEFFSELNQRLDNVEKSKDFANSAYTKRIEKIAPFEVNQDGDVLLLGFVGAMLMIFLLGSVVNQIFGDFAAGCVAVTLFSALTLYVLFTALWVPYRMKTWRNKAEKLGLSTSRLYQEPFELFTVTMSASSKLEVIKCCEQAGATPKQIQKLYELTADDICFVWWDHLFMAAKRGCSKQDKIRQQSAISCAHAEAEEAALQEIARNLQQDAPLVFEKKFSPQSHSVKV